MEVKVGYGVPQCSCLGPILLSIYVTDMTEKINICSLIQYNDTQFLQADNIDNLNNLISNTEDTLRDTKRYFLTNGLLLNKKKNEMHFHWKQTASIKDSP